MRCRIDLLCRFRRVPAAGPEASAASRQRSISRSRSFSRGFDRHPWILDSIVAA